MLNQIINIFAPITSLGGSVTVIRISGFEILNCLTNFNVNINNINQLSQSKIKLIKLHDENNHFLDEALILYFQSPNSFTGEDILEFNLHSSRYIVDKTLEILSKIINFRFAKNGEFTKRAVLNNKLDLIKAESINMLIKSETREQHRLSSEMFAGNVSKKYEEIRNQLITIISKVEILIDFSEEDIAQELSEEIKILESLKILIQEQISNENSINHIIDGITVAIIGKPNAGKSSLINFLAKKDIAIVSHIPGTTRDIITANIDINGYKVTFFDTAGIRNITTDEIEMEGINRAIKISKNSDFNILIIDITENIIQDVADNVFENNIKINDDTIIILNKIDILQSDNNINNINFNINDICKKLNIEKNINKIIPISIKNNDNLDILLFEIGNKIKQKFMIHNESIAFNDRHKSLLQSVLKVLNDFTFDKSVELLSEDLKYIISIIGEITGKIYTEDILDNIFSRFCIGK